MCMCLWKCLCVCVWNGSSASDDKGSVNQHLAAITVPFFSISLCLSRIFLNSFYQIYSLLDSFWRCSQVSVMLWHFKVSLSLSSRLTCVCIREYVCVFCSGKLVTPVWHTVTLQDLKESYRVYCVVAKQRRAMLEKNPLIDRVGPACSTDAMLLPGPSRSWKGWLRKVPESFSSGCLFKMSSMWWLCQRPHMFNAVQRAV